MLYRQTTQNNGTDRPFKIRFIVDSFSFKGSGQNNNDSRLIIDSFVAKHWIYCPAHLPQTGSGQDVYRVQYSVWIWAMFTN